MSAKIWRMRKMPLNFTNLLGEESTKRKGLDNFIEWNIDPDGGFAPWRDWGADQLNHQNTTIVILII